MIADFRQRLMASTLLVGAATCASPAFAQATPPSASPEAAQATAEAVSDAGPQPESEIVVTGSRLARPDLEASSPIAVVGQQEIQVQAASANIENVLNDLPQVTATTSGTSNNPGGGVATVNLRGLGGQRTLVLVNGRRYVSFDVNQQVDLNTIPAALIDRVDVVTGGASAVYGSDAIAGVVNFIMKKNFSGVQVDGSYDITEAGDGQIFNTSVTMGTNFDEGRGNVTLFGNYMRRSDTFAGERGFSRFAASDVGTTIFGGGSPSVPFGRVNIAGLGDATGLGCNNIDFQGGVPSCFIGATEGYNFNPINYLQVPQERYMISAMGQYEISDHFRPYTELTFINNRVLNQLAATPISQSSAFGNPAEGGTIGSVAGGLQLQVNSPFLTPAFQAALATLDTDDDGYVPAAVFGFRGVQLGPRVNDDDRNAYRVVAGLAGDLWGGWDYDTHYMYARTKNTQRQSGNFNITNFLAGVQTAFRNPETGEISAFPFAGLPGGGELVCANQEVSGCTPVNIFGENNLSPEAVNFIGLTATNVETYSTQVYNATVTNNDLFDLGAGGIGVAFGAEWRKEAGRVDPDPQLTSGNVAGFNSGLATGGSYQVREFFGETRVPLIKEGFIHRLELNGAARFTKYSNAPGNVFTWAAGAELAPVRDITFRGQYQKAIRGPSINELFLGDAVNFPGNLDRCGTAAALTNPTINAICVAQFTAAGAPLSNIGNPAIQDPNNVNPATFLRGNPDLIEETAKTFTVGAILTPTFLPRFTATVDYYHIKISDIILLLGIPIDTIGSFCFDDNNQTYCDRFTRNPVGEVEAISNPAINGGSLETSGIDVSAGYNMPLGPLIGATSRLSFNINGSYLLKNDLIALAEFPDQVIKCAGNFGANCGVPTPKWKHTARLGLTSGPVTISGQWRHIGSVKDDDDDTDYAVEKLPARNYFDLSTLFDIGEHYQMGLGVSNIFDKKPPIVAGVQQGGNGEQSNTFPTIYDVLGRSYFVSGRLKF
jgi:outer membrane receptor protein involved in Fe transport